MILRPAPPQSAAFVRWGACAGEIGFAVSHTLFALQSFVELCGGMPYERIRCPVE